MRAASAHDDRPAEDAIAAAVVELAGRLRRHLDRDLLVQGQDHSDPELLYNDLRRAGLGDLPDERDVRLDAAAQDDAAGLEALRRHANLRLATALSAAERPAHAGAQARERNGRDGQRGRPLRPPSADPHVSIPSWFVVLNAGPGRPGPARDRLAGTDG